jgi:spermidine synthase
MNQQWFIEHYFNQSAGNSYKVSRVLHSEQSKWQKIEVLETEAVGRLLLLDGKTMVSDKDEFVYHEVMSHIPMMVHPQVKHVLIIGGGDGGLVSEFVKWKEIESISLVEIDQRVVEVCQEFFPKCTKGLQDPRVTIFTQDGIEFIKQYENHFDIIIVDSTDPVDFAQGLFTQEFYANIKRALTANGIMMAQTENPFFDEYSIKDIYDNLRASFPIVESFAAPMPIYPGCYWSFAFASKTLHANQLQTSKLDELKTFEDDLLWYNHQWHQGAYLLSNFHKKMTGVTQC